ncbi:MAG TPA: hypothetical protein VFQ99_06100, partial [Gallionella sp.]|nr:hypothetical protein [Gallionella sp.]
MVNIMLMRKPHLNHEEHEGREEEQHVALTNENCLAGECPVPSNYMIRGWQGYRRRAITRKNLRALRALRGEWFSSGSYCVLHMRRGQVADDAAVEKPYLAFGVAR